MPKFQPTDDHRYTVEMMATVGIDHDTIARVIGKSKPTLYKYFRDELDMGKAKTTTRIAESLIMSALAGNTTAQIFYLKCRAGWSDRGHEAPGKKQQQKRKAEDAGRAGRYAVQSAPKLAVDNTG